MVSLHGYILIYSMYNEINFTYCDEASADVRSKAVLLLFIYCLLLLPLFGVRSLLCFQRQYFVSFQVVGRERTGCFLCSECHVAVIVL